MLHSESFLFSSSGGKNSEKGSSLGRGGDAIAKSITNPSIIPTTHIISASPYQGQLKLPYYGEYYISGFDEKD